MEATSKSWPECACSVGSSNSTRQWFSAPKISLQGLLKHGVPGPTPCEGGPNNLHFWQVPSSAAVSDLFKALSSFLKPSKFG